MYRFRILAQGPGDFHPETFRPVRCVASEGERALFFP